MKKKKTLIALFAILGGILIATGATYAWFSYGKTGTKQHTISSGSIKFHYSEDSQGITLSDAMPMTDAQGMATDYFEFSIDSKTSDTVDIPYYITARRSGTGTNMDNVVKVYLTKVVSGVEQPVEVVTGKTIAKVSELGNYINNDGINIPNTEHLLHTDKVFAGTSSYHEVYRLRMWIDSSANFIEQNTVYKCNGTEVEYNSTEYNACDPSNLTSEVEDVYPYNGKTYTLKVNVYSSAVEVNQSTVQLRANTDVNDISIGNDILTTSGESTTFEGTATMPAGETSMTKQIAINTENPNSTVTVEKLNPTTGAVVEEITGDSTNVTLNLGLGENSFRITVRSEDGQETASYTLNITVAYPSYEVTMAGSNVTFGSNSINVIHGNTNTVTVTPASGHYISNGSCTNGYTITGLTTGTSATTSQTVTINNNNNTGDSTCTFTVHGIDSTVTLNNQSATTAGTASVTGTYGSAMPSITVPTKTGYTFGGYYTETNGGGTKYYNADGTSTKTWDKTSATTLYAKWTAYFSTYLKGLSNSATVIHEDETVDKNMRFIGSNPNNYVSLPLSDGTTELFRVIGVFNSSSHGRSGENLVKLVRAESLGNMAWDTRQNAQYNNSYGYNVWTGSTLSTTLNGSTYKYVGSNYIQEVTWKTGATSYTNATSTNGASNLYTGERSNTVSAASSYITYTPTWTGKVALPYMSDVLYSTNGYDTTTRSTCLSSSPSVGNNTMWRTSATESNRSPCSRGSWLIEYASNNSTILWTLSAGADYSFSASIVGYVSTSGVLRDDTVNSSRGVLPSVYLKQSVVCTNCNDATAGTSSKPWILSLN